MNSFVWGCLQSCLGLGCRFTSSLLLFLFSCYVVSNYFTTPWTVARQAPLSMEFPRQEYWSGLPFPSLGDLPKSGIKPGSPTLQSELPGKPNKASITLQSWRHFMVIKKMPPRGFPGGPVAKMLCSQCKGPEFDPWSRNYDPPIPRLKWKDPPCSNEDPACCN